MSRKDYLYVNLDKNLVKIVDACVASIFSNGAQVYKTRSDFVTKSIQYQIDKEKLSNAGLENILKKAIIEVRHQLGGNRIAPNK